MSFLPISDLTRSPRCRKKPSIHKKNVPIGMLGSLGVCTLLYILTALVLTGVASYTLLNVPDPMSIALHRIGLNLSWLGFVIKLAILAGLASVVLVMMLGLTRIIYAIGMDRLLPKALAKVHPSTQTPLFATFIVGLATAAISGFFPIDILGQLAAMSTLFILPSNESMWPSSIHSPSILSRMNPRRKSSAKSSLNSAFFPRA